MPAALVTLVTLVMVFSCGVVPGVALHETIAKESSTAAATSLHAISHGAPTSAAAGPGAEGSAASRSPVQTAGDSTADPASDVPHPPTDAAGSQLNSLILDMWPAAVAAGSHADPESPSPRPGQPIATRRRSAAADRGRSGDDASGASITTLLPQFGTYWRALNDFLGDADLGQPGAVDAALEQLFETKESDRRSSETRGGKSTSRSGRSRGSTATGEQRPATEEVERLPEPSSSRLESEEAADEGAQSHAASAAEDGMTTASSPGKHSVSNESRSSTASSPFTFVEPVSDSETNSPAQQPKEHRARTGAAWARRNGTGQPIAALAQRLPGVLNNGTILRMLAGRWAAAAGNSSSHGGRGAFSSSAGIRALGRLFARHRAATASSNGTDGSSSNNSSNDSSSSSSRSAFNFKGLGRLLARHRAAASASRGSSSNSSENEASSALNSTSGSTEHRLHTTAAASATAMSTDGDTSKTSSRRPGVLPHREPGRLGSRTATANDSRSTPGRKGDPPAAAWTSSASSLLVELLTPGRLADTVSEAVGSASSRLTDQLLGRMIQPLKMVAGRASSQLSRLPKLLAPAERLIMGDLAGPVRPQRTASRSRAPRSEMERLQRQLRYSESGERAMAAEMARLRRRLADQRLAARADWSVAAAERNGDMMAHLWTLQP